MLINDRVTTISYYLYSKKSATQLPRFKSVTISHPLQRYHHNRTNPPNAPTCTPTQILKATPTPTPRIIGITKLVPPAANKHRARLTLALAPALCSGNISTR